MNIKMNISIAVINNLEYTNREDRCPRLEFTVDDRPAFISELREDYFTEGGVRLYSFDPNTNWEKLLPEIYIDIEDRRVKLMGYSNDNRIKAMARQFIKDLDNGTFIAGQTNLKNLFANITQL